MKKSLLFLMIFVISLTPVSFAESDSPQVLVNGVEVEFPDQQPVIIDYRTMIPMRSVFETMGAVVEWIDAEQKVTIELNERVVSLYIGNPEITVSTIVRSGTVTMRSSPKTITMDVCPILLNGRTLIPIRFAAESLGATVEWDEEAYAVNIIYSDEDGGSGFTITKTATIVTDTYTDTNIPVTVSSFEEFEDKVIELVNEERANAGLAPLAKDNGLMEMARFKSQDMADNNYFAHESPTHGSFSDLLKKFNIQNTVAGENIAMGQRTAEAVMQSWMNSPGHKGNILNSDYTRIGVGCAQSANGSYYWTQEFAR